MRIPIEKLISDYNKKNPSKKLTERKFAIAMFNAGLYDSIQAGQNAIQQWKKEKIKSIVISHIIFLAQYFRVNGSRVIDWDDDIK